jgi:orc1/cdc6 family replication initiation protein
MHSQHAEEIITDPAVFQEDWVPADLRHRDAELNLLSTALEPVLAGEPAGDVFVWGPSGSGKTSAARFLLGELRERADELTTHYLSCWSERTRHRVLYNVLEGVGAAPDEPQTAISAGELHTRIERAVDGPAVVVLDEVDQLETPDVLYDLYHTPGLALFLVANREDQVLSRLEPRLRSRLANATSVQFDRYDIEALVAILAQRAEHGLHPDAVERHHLEHIADAAAGNARDAIRILATAARLAASEGETSLSTGRIDQAVPAARTELRETRRERLGEHQYALYAVITDAGEISPGEAYERYAERVEEPRSRRRVRDYVRKLAEYGLVAVHGQNRGRRYEAVGDEDERTE